MRSHACGPPQPPQTPASGLHSAAPRDLSLYPPGRILARIDSVSFRIPASRRSTLNPLSSACFSSSITPLTNSPRMPCCRECQNSRSHCRRAAHAPPHRTCRSRPVSRLAAIAETPALGKYATRTGYRLENARKNRCATRPINAFTYTTQAVRRDYGLAAAAAR